MSEIALVGKKIGMTREFYKTGQSVPVTVLKVEKGRIVQLINKEKRGYDAIQLGFGNIKNSVNYPQIIEPMETSYRLTIANKNVSGMIGKITAIIAEEGLNIIDMKNRSRDDIAYNVIDLDSEPSNKSIEAIKVEENIINVRQING